MALKNSSTRLRSWDFSLLISGLQGRCRLAISAHKVDLVLLVDETIGLDLFAISEGNRVRRILPNVLRSLEPSNIFQGIHDFSIPFEELATKIMVPKVSLYPPCLLLDYIGFHSSHYAPARNSGSPAIIFAYSASISFHAC
jgi:hypothetical protein